MELTHSERSLGEPLVSIVIPCFNQGQYLGEAVRSVLNQTYKSVEILIVDDGSRDHTRQVAEDFGESVQYFHQENRGLSAARNRGIQSAKGALLGFLDADDCFYPTKLEKQVCYLRDNPEAGLVYCGWDLVRDGDFRLLQTEIPHLQHDFADELLTHSIFHVPCPLVRREVMDRIGFFDEQLTSCEDREFWLRVAQHGVRFDCVSEVLCWIRDRSNSMNKDHGRMYENRLMILAKHGNSLSSEMVAAKRARIHLRACLEYLRDGEKGLAVKCLERALRDNSNLLERVSVLMDLVRALSGNRTGEVADPGVADAVLDELRDITGKYISGRPAKKQIVSSRLALARFASRAGHRPRRRMASLAALLAIFRYGVSFNRLEEAIRGIAAIGKYTGQTSQAREEYLPKTVPSPSYSSRVGRE